MSASSLLSPIHRVSLASPILSRTFSPPFLCVSVRNFGLKSSRYLNRRHVVRLITAKVSDENHTEDYAELEGNDIDELEIVDDSELEAVGDSDDETFPTSVETLEEEARNAVREFSRALSQELRIENEANDQKETGGKKRRLKSAMRKVPDNLLQKVTIVGRPNVGKSALFNRLVGGNKAIVVDEPGVTRDRLYGRSFWGNYEFMVVDTGGVLTISKSQATVMEDLAITTTIGMDAIPLAAREAAAARMPSMIERQAAAAVEESSVIIFLVDGQAWKT